MDGGEEDPHKELQPYTPVRNLAATSGGSPGLNRQSGSQTPDFARGSGAGKPPTSPPSAGGSWPWNSAKPNRAGSSGLLPGQNGSPRDKSDETKAFEQVRKQ